MNAFLQTPATWVLVGANVLLFLAEERAGGSANPEVALRFGAQTLDRLRAGQWYRLGTSMFLHFGLLHLLCNMYALYNLGPALEEFYGLVPFLALYLLSGLAGNLLTAFRDARSARPAVSAGASGAVFGLLGAYLALAILPATRAAIDVSSLATVLVLNLAIGFSTPAINMAAHLGGLLAGLLLGFLFFPFA
ncbi:MAG: rhomboid family intramembrane serine protease [Kiritimatiellae bacterium]|nr:rhomboid family intramembrane serine protease [Kiritimatiellia bacterium]